MSGYSQILVAVDFSEHSERAVQRALALAKVHNAQMTLVHVSEMPVYPVFDEFAAMGAMTHLDMELQERLQKQAHQRLDRLAIAQGAKDYPTLVRSGSAKGEILQLAEELQADLIVMGRHGHSGIAALMGSTTDGVMHGAKCDLLAVSLD